MNRTYFTPAHLGPIRLLRCSLTHKRYFLIAIAILTLSSLAGCKKNKAASEVDDVSFYGYGKLTVDCEKKCHVTFGDIDKVNDFDVDGTMATYVFRYQSKYNLDIKITPETDQNITMNVYSREQYQIFHNTAKRTAGQVWESKILVP
ncbi:MAG: hypothetical protein AAGC65_17550 [Mucilaginibacter sp.]|uniref:hypothetical protein n=1 Tax=Mucilaginibacter sp. TaxID=1882438 RepID=UPI0031B0E3FB